MLKLLKKLNIVVIAFILLLPLIKFSSSANATEYKAVTLHFLEPTKDELKGRSDLEILIWRVKDSEETNTKIVKELDKLTDKELEEKFGKEVAKYTTDKEGKIVLDSLSDGKYYVREKDYGTKKGIYSVPFILDIPNKNEDIYIKTTTNPGEEPKGGYKFKKVSSQTNDPLKNAKFKVTKQKNGIYEPVLQDNKVYIVSSAEDGMFKVENLDYGVYYLWEVDAPSGYTPLKEPIKFEVTELSINEEEKIIKNDPFNPPPDILIPNTGDVLFVVLLFGGIIIFSLGYRMTKEEN
ncbi:MSCRAMM family protein [Gemelliphila palaticanis]|uniref:Prealbumin-like fold domain-containing protein n=1 Tax=Gemelliphila palaticanis TaxID=81950 RepID=A0ABX2SXX4_9BACL|nr:prealbumin-like fold domain-containing protein [Gemella palaticanis]MBF0715205.1 hypothetical protein [Gemella palaticanis]NYS47135.1 prealbumin-like fold domain-containing protein [Gemella palaticanis]